MACRQHSENVGRLVFIRALTQVAAQTAKWGRAGGRRIDMVGQLAYHE